MNTTLSYTHLSPSHLSPGSLSPAQRFLRGTIQGLELLLVAAIGIPALLTEQMEPGVLIIGLSLLLLPIALRLLVTGQPGTPTLALWPLFLLAILCAVTVRVTPSWQHTWPELVRLLWGLALCLAVLNWINPAAPAGDQRHTARRWLSPHLVWATLAFFGLGVALTTVGVLSMGPTNKIARFDQWLALLPRLDFATTGGFNPNRVAGVAVLFAPLAVALALGPLLSERRTLAIWLGWLVTKPLAGALALFFSTVLLLTQSRGAWLALGCAVLVMLLLLGRRGWLLLAIGAIIGVSVVAAIGPTRLLDKLTVHDLRAIDPQALIQDRNIAGRLILWQRALHGMADAPLTGMGLGAFEAVSQQPYPQVAGFKPDPDMSHVHNIILQMGVDFGVPGVIAFVALLLMMGFLLVKLVRRAVASSPLHTWSLGLLGSFIAYLVYSMFDAITLGARPSIAVWFFFGLCLGAGEWAQMAATEAAAQPVAQPTTRPPQSPSVPTPTILAPQVQPTTIQEEWEARAMAATSRSGQ